MNTIETAPNEYTLQFAYIKSVLGSIPAFGDSIGENVSKAQLAIVLEKVKWLEEQHQKLFFDLEDAHARLSRDLPYSHELLVNMRSALGITHW